MWPAGLCGEGLSQTPRVSELWAPLFPVWLQGSFRRASPPLRSPLWPVPFARALPLWPDPLTKAFCAEVSGAWLWSQKPHGGRGGRRKGGWGRGLTHSAGADGEEKHRLVCLSGGSSTRWESLVRRVCSHTNACGNVCVCGGGRWESPHLCHKCWGLVGILVGVYLPEGLTVWAVDLSWTGAVCDFPPKQLPPSPPPARDMDILGVCQCRSC